MTLLDILGFVSNIESLFTKRTICFFGKQYPLLFFSSLFQKIRSQGVMVESVNLSDEEFLHIQIRLGTTFLGQRILFWFSNIQNYDAITRKKFLELVSTYSGPHLLWYFDTDATDGISIDLTTFKKHDIAFLCKTFVTDANQNKEMIFFGHNLSGMHIDQALLLVHYHAMIGASVEFEKEWLGKIIAPQTSLFLLAQHFFARIPKSFYPIWYRLKNNYNTAFWTTYWSEQLWSAYHMIVYKKKNQLVQAKQMSMRLPFSFVQKDWKQIDPEELAQMHDLIYKTDCLFKNGASDLTLEMMYQKFFSKSEKRIQK